MNCSNTSGVRAERLGKYGEWPFLDPRLLARPEGLVERSHRLQGELAGSLAAPLGGSGRRAMAWTRILPLEATQARSTPSWVCRRHLSTINAATWLTWLY
jgi:hypothetical protein